MNRKDEAHPPAVARIDEAHRVRVDEALGSWRQGDCVLGDQVFLFRLNPGAPISEAAAVAALDGADAAETQVHGFAVVTQTCDVAVGNLPLDAADGEVHLRQPPRRVVLPQRRGGAGGGYASTATVGAESRNSRRR